MGLSSRLQCRDARDLIELRSLDSRTVLATLIVKSPAVRAQNRILIEQRSLNIPDIEIAHLASAGPGQGCRHPGRVPDGHAGPGAAQRGL